MIIPVEDVFADVQADALYKELRTVLSKYGRTLQSDRRHLLEEFTLVQVARKVVGVGSVGTRAWIVLMEAGDGTEPLFLQAKLEPSLEAAGVHTPLNQGERVVAGQPQPSPRPRATSSSAGPAPPCRIRSAGTSTSAS